ncbi:MAG TPA: TlpA disulfide reductase family protein [Paracoccaceae bacterium]|nr:TlpA disulfide reductase family protein [Paracoccaceae bacterium]
MRALAPLAAALFYACLALLASPVRADLPAEVLDELRAMRAGDMRKLALHDRPAAPLAAAFIGEDGAERTLAADRGRLVLLNFWATWCAPCREEMPALNALQKTLGGPDFAVLTVATGRNSPAAMRKFFAEHGIDALPLHADPKAALGREAGVLGLPVTLILDREGREIGRLTGGADWNAPEAHALIERLIAATAP